MRATQACGACHAIKKGSVGGNTGIDLMQEEAEFRKWTSFQVGGYISVQSLTIAIIESEVNVNNSGEDLVPK